MIKESLLFLAIIPFVFAGSKSKRDACSHFKSVSVSFDSRNRRLIRNFLAGSVLLCPVESSNCMKSDHGRTGVGADL